MLVDAEQLARDHRALRRRLAEAKLKLAEAYLEDLDYSGRKLDRAIMRHLATCRWVADSQNVLITGPTGVGKSFLACALGQQACRQGIA
jgi:DNA replication protein DnaC